MNRIKILNFLQWNDSNGAYTDDNAIIEGYKPLTFIEAIRLFVHVMGELEEDFSEINLSREFKKNPIVKTALLILLGNNDSVTTYRTVIDIL